LIFDLLSPSSNLLLKAAPGGILVHQRLILFARLQNRSPKEFGGQVGGASHTFTVTYTQLLTQG
jgi:hypothetical protein